MRAQVQKVPQIVELLKKKSFGLQHFKPTSSVCVLEEKDAVAPAQCPHAASRTHGLDTIPGPTNWPLVGSLFQLLCKGGLTRQHEALVQYPYKHLHFCLFFLIKMFSLYSFLNKLLVLTSIKSLFYFVTLDRLSQKVWQDFPDEAGLL